MFINSSCGHNGPYSSNSKALFYKILDRVGFLPKESDEIKNPSLEDVDENLSEEEDMNVIV